MPRRSTDPALWTRRPKFGPAGGPDEVSLTQAGLSRAFAVGAQVREGPASSALATLASAGGESSLEQRVPHTAKIVLTDLGRAFEMTAWYHLQSLGYVEVVPPSPSRGLSVRLTNNGRTAVERGASEQDQLLERCRSTANEISADDVDPRELRGWRLYHYDSSHRLRAVTDRLPVSVVAERSLLQRELLRTAESLMGPREGEDFAIVRSYDDELPLRAVSRRDASYIRAEHH